MGYYTEKAKEVKAKQDAELEQLKVALQTLNIVPSFSCSNNWEADTKYAVGDRRRHGGKVYKCLQAHTSQADWEPPAVPALWVVVNVSSPGTIDDPIQASRGMEYEYGKYYLDPEDSKTYLCKRLNETGTIVLYYLPHELVGHYFEEVANG